MKDSKLKMFGDKDNKTEDFLELLQSAKRGKLKVYIGSIAGIGKTFKMLQEAHELTARGADIVLAYVETHGRKDTEALLAGLEIIPRLKYEYRGVFVEEIDLDAVLARKPQIVIVDELAHTNLPLCRNQKRYQDVIELLLAGINVICAFNVQHLESLNDLVEKTTGIKVLETIPDSFLKQADQVINIDLAAEDLLDRLKSGKIYRPENIKNAMDNFFKPENIKILRELALREVAETVDKPMYDTKVSKIGLYNENKKTSGEKLMVCLNPEKYSQKYLLRKASRLAGKLSTDWFVVYVEEEENKPENLESDVQRNLYSDIQLAKELGGQFIHLRGDNKLKSWVNFAYREGVSHIVLNITGETWINWFLGKSLLQRLIKEKRSFDIYLMSHKPDVQPISEGEK
jgi:two-component system sensor histidine kinase KdpD